jgi:S1-C subfamily serine protease
MKIVLIFTLLLTTLLSEDNLKSSIVKIYTTHKNLNYLEPWNVSTYQASGSGVIIDDKRILTNAHVVANTTYIEIKHFGKSKRYKAKVIAVSHQADLALLSVQDKSFFNNTQDIEIGSLPFMRQKVSIYGFPLGGTTLSISDGIVSRIEHFRYKHSGEAFLGIQVDAAINPGNSGGPAISDGKIVGIVMQNNPSAQNIGYLVPPPIIKHFLKDIEDGKYDGFASLGIVSINLENPAMREFHGLSKDQSGHLITYITYNEQHGFKVGDIITAINGKKIENDGSVSFRKDEFTNYKYCIDSHQIGETIIVDVIRDGKEMKIPLTLKNKINELLLVKILQYDVMPSYIIHGGYIFSPLTNNLLSQSKNIPMRLKKYLRLWPTKDKKDVVVLIKVLADESNQGNHGITFLPIEKVNGKSISSFDDFKHIVKHSKEKFLLLEDEDGFQIVIDNVKARKNEKKLLNRYNISSNQSVKSD